MKKTSVIWLAWALAMAVGGCTNRTEAAAAATPSPTPVVTEAPAAATPAPTFTPEPTPEPTPTPTPTPASPPELRWDREEEPARYTLLIGGGDGAKALGAWLQGPGAALAADYVPAGLAEPMYTLRFTPEEEELDIPDATEETGSLRLAVDDAIIGSGLLAAVLPDFEEEYGYTVEVYAGDGAINGGVSAALVTESAAAGLGGGFAVSVPYLSTVYVPAESY